MKPIRVAVFDVDGTLIPHTSLEILFSRRLLRKHIIGAPQILAYLVHVFYGLREDVTEAVRRNKYYLRGVPLNRVQAEIPEFHEKIVRPRLEPRVVQKMKFLKKEGHKILLLSGSLTLLLNHFSTYLPVDVVLGCNLETRGGIFTGRVQGIHPYGKDKVTVFQQWAQTQTVDLGGSWAFGDRWSDRHLLRLFGHCVVVNPGHTLREWAQRHSCEQIVSEV
jgi:HAD superfamily hydrolase (TIGR01490 family)